MKSFLTVFLWVFSVLLSNAEEPKRWSKRCHPDSAGPWIGVHLDWVEPETAAQLRDVPLGFGLVVKSLESSSPAEEAGLLPLDILWKLEDQLIANKWQLFSLLKMKGVGAEVELSIFRGGETLTLPITIGIRPAAEDALTQAARTVLAPLPDGTPMLGIRYNSRSGFIADGDRTVSLTRKREGYEYIISDGQEELAKGTLAGAEQDSWPSGLDEDSRAKLLALVQSIQRAEAGEGPSPRSPRVRRVPEVRAKSSK